MVIYKLSIITLIISFCANKSHNQYNYADGNFFSMNWIFQLTRMDIATTAGRQMVTTTNLPQQFTTRHVNAGINNTLMNTRTQMLPHSRTVLFRMPQIIVEIQVTLVTPGAIQPTLMFAGSHVT